MKALNIEVKPEKRRKYRSLSDALRQAIWRGIVKPGERLPSTREMALQFKMHRHTVMTALSELESEGWIQARSRRFFQVTDTLPDTFLRVREGKRPAIVASPKHIKIKTVAVRDYQAIESYRHSFPSGLADLRQFPLAEFKSFVYDALKSKGVLSYGEPSGHESLIVEINNYLRRVRGIDNRQIVITNGSQEALFLLAETLISAGDKVAVEALCYPPTVEALRFAGAKLVPVEIDEEGLVVEDLEAKLRRHRIKVLCTTPLHQYPTTVTLSASRRLRLYEVALKHGITIIEDDYDHEFHYSGQPVAPLASFDPAGIVLYLSTFSKILFPGARLGFMAVPEYIAQAVSRLKQISSRQNEQITQFAIAYWMKSGGFENHLRKMRRLYSRRKDSLMQDLVRLQTRFKQISWREPDGGMALWLSIGEDSSALAARVKKHSILLNPEQNFRLDGEPGFHLRLGFSAKSSHENHAALETLFEHVRCGRG